MCATRSANAKTTKSITRRVTKDFMKTETPKTIYRKDYRPPVFEVDAVEMGFDLDPAATTVATRLHLMRSTPGPLTLDGEALELLFISVDGRRLTAQEYTLEQAAEKQTLTIAGLPDSCALDIAVRLAPETNSSLMGLYVSNGNFFTQCEAEGFRKITFFPDRPDVMTRYTVMLRADKQRYPVLLSNGNLIDSGTLPGAHGKPMRHYATWQDPFPKPSYLFALVAGKLGHIERRVKTQSGRPVLLQIYAEPGELGKVDHALASLVNALRWDEARFGLELDLDRFMIVAVGDFNMGAMENKGLNIFNTKYVLADARTETDMDFANIEAVVGHEYFHNWTGNRVTCRDWFQLTLKEGLTVFRDQEFSADMATGLIEKGALRPDDATERSLRAAHRIDAVRSLRAVQFPEDAGPMAHPVRPDSYQEIGNFYTATVYQKGAEVIRMQQTLLGRDGFRAGMDEYFRRHDGEAVSCDDFVAAMESVYAKRNPGKDQAGFRRWYSQAGTPRVLAETGYDAAAKKLTLTLRQLCPKVGIEKRGSVEKMPFHIPFAVGLLDDKGNDIALKLEGEAASPRKTTGHTRLLELTEAEQCFVFVDVDAKPVPSLLRNFSAPVIVDFAYTDEELALLSAHDSDPFNRWEAGQRLATRELVRLTHAAEQGEALVLSPALIDVYRTTLADPSLDASLKESAITLPSEGVIGEQLPVYDPAAVRQARSYAHVALSRALATELRDVHAQNRTPGPYSPDAQTAGRRALKNCALGYLARLEDPAATQLVEDQLADADNMTDRLAAFTALVSMPEKGMGKQRKQAIDSFYERFSTNPLVVDKWLRVQATAHEIDEPVLDIVARLTKHAAYSPRNPNKVYALLGGFFGSNAAAFHRVDGKGYAFWVEQVLTLDSINPSVAGRLARALDRWQKLTPGLQSAARDALARIRAAKTLSRDVREIVEKALGV